MAKVQPGPIDGTLRKFSLRVPAVIREYSGITVFGKRIKSLVFSTDIPIIETGGPTEESIRNTIESGANAITWTPPSNAEIFKTVMAAYRNGESHP